MLSEVHGQANAHIIPFYSSQLRYSYLDVPTFLQTGELVIIDILDMAPSKATSESCDPFWFLKERCQVSDENMCRKKEQLCVCGLKAVYKKHVSFSFTPRNWSASRSIRIGTLPASHGSDQFSSWTPSNGILRNPYFFSGSLQVTTVFLRVPHGLGKTYFVEKTVSPVWPTGIDGFPTLIDGFPTGTWKFGWFGGRFVIKVRSTTCGKHKMFGDLFFWECYFQDIDTQITRWRAQSGRCVRTTDSTRICYPTPSFFTSGPYAGTAQKDMFNNKTQVQEGLGVTPAHAGGIL